MNPTFCDHAWAVPAKQFVEVWNCADSLDEAVTTIRGVAGGPTPRRALMARAAELRKLVYTLRMHTLSAVKIEAGAT